MHSSTIAADSSTGAGASGRDASPGWQRLLVIVLPAVAVAAVVACGVIIAVVLLIKRRRARNNSKPPASRPIPEITAPPAAQAAAPATATVADADYVNVTQYEDTHYMSLLARREEPPAADTNDDYQNVNRTYAQIVL